VTETLAIEPGKIYKITPQYDHRNAAFVRVQSILHSWTDDNGNAQIAVWACRVRPADLSVSFGNNRGYVARVSQFELIEPKPGSERNVSNPRACDLHLIIDCSTCCVARVSQFELIEANADTLISTASLTGARIFRTDDAAYYAVCSCGQRSPDHYVTDIDAQRWAGKHWTAKPYCDAPQRPENR
jgi:hypothetical protein